jgi:hypothetical protein
MKYLAYVQYCEEYADYFRIFAQKRAKEMNLREYMQTLENE